MKDEILNTKDLIHGFGITLYVTENCNLKCTYCYQGNCHSNKRMTFELACDVIDKALKNEYFNEIEKIYKEMSSHFKERLKEFKNMWENGTNKDIHLELSFCILTPQSKALNAWQAITNLKKDNLIYNGKAEELVEFLNIVRFKNNKAKYLVELREQMTKDGKIITKDFFNSLPTVTEKREWIVKNIKGMSYKEASHFLRNIGFGENIAILENNKTKNLVVENFKQFEYKDPKLRLRLSIHRLYSLHASIWFIAEMYP